MKSRGARVDTHFGCSRPLRWGTVTCPVTLNALLLSAPYPPCVLHSYDKPMATQPILGIRHRVIFTQAHLAKRSLLFSDCVEEVDQEEDHLGHA